MNARVFRRLVCTGRVQTLADYSHRDGSVAPIIAAVWPDYLYRVQGAPSAATLGLVCSINIDGREEDPNAFIPAVGLRRGIVANSVKISVLGVAGQRVAGYVAPGLDAPENMGVCRGEVIVPRFATEFRVVDLTREDSERPAYFEWLDLAESPDSDDGILGPVEPDAAAFAQWSPIPHGAAAVITHDCAIEFRRA